MSHLAISDKRTEAVPINNKWNVTNIAVTECYFMWTYIAVDLI